MIDNFCLYKTFYYVATSKSFIEASKKLHIASSTISYQISKLEEQLDAKLFYRTNKGIKLTPFGSNLYSSVSNDISILECKVKDAKQKSDLANATIRIGCPSHIATYYLMDAIQLAKKEYPNLNLQIISTYTAKELLTQLISNEINFALLDKIELEDNNLVVTKFASVDNILVSKEPLTINHIKELENLNYILNLDSSNTNIKLFDIFKKCGLTIKNFIESDVTELRVDAVKRNIGVGYVMRKAVEKELKNGELFEIELPIKFPTVDINLLYMKNNSRRIDKNFIKNFLKTCFLK